MTPLQLEALAVLSKTKYGQAVLDVLESRLKELDAVCRTASVATVQVAQGRAQEIARLLDEIRGAEQALERVRKPA